MSTPSDRAGALLRLLVERHIADGEPVGSKTISRLPGVNLSPASIRAVLADLEEGGFLASPHTSAGRLPTALGYRYFVDHLNLAPEALPEDVRSRIASELVPPERELDASGPEAHADRISQTLARLTRMAGVVSVPRRNRAVLRRIEFYPLDDAGGRVLVVLVVNGHEVQNRVIRPARAYGTGELAELSALLNEHFAGSDLLGLRDRLRAEAHRLKQDLDRELRAALVLAEQALEPSFAPAGSGPETLVYAGGANLLESDGAPPDVERLRSLFAALDRQREVLGLFERCLTAEGVRIFIGDDSGYRVLEGYSLVSAPYVIDGRPAGVLGVIGPSRMPYSRIIPLVGEAARILGREPHR